MAIWRIPPKPQQRRNYLDAYPQILVSTGISNTTAAGTPTLKYNQTLTVTGISQIVSFGTLALPGEPVIGVVERLIGATSTGTMNALQNIVYYSRFTAIATGFVSEIKVYSKVSGNAKVAIYSDNAGNPDDRLAYNPDFNNTQTVTANQWNVLLVPKLFITTNTVYWLGISIDTTGALSYSAANTGTTYYKTVIFSEFEWPETVTASELNHLTNEMAIAGFGVLGLVPKGIIQSVSFGTPIFKFNQTLAPNSITETLVIGTAGLKNLYQILQPSSITQAITYGHIEVIQLKYNQILNPLAIAQVIENGKPILLILNHTIWGISGYGVLPQLANKVVVTGVDSNSNLVYGEAKGTNINGETLNLVPEPMITNPDEAKIVAANILAKQRLNTLLGQIQINPNVGTELWDIISINDAWANQAYSKYRVAGWTLNYQAYVAGIQDAKYEMLFDLTSV